MAAVKLNLKNWLALPLILMAIAAFLFSACAKPALPPATTYTPTPTSNPTPTLPTTNTTNITTTPAPTEPNQPPIIVKMETSEQGKIRVWNTAVIECIAEDPDGDQITYIWSATGGKIHGGGKEIGWIAPGVKGEYTVTVMATDDKGGEAKESITFDVFCCEK